MGWRTCRQYAVIVGWLMLLGHLGCHVAAYLVTPWDLAVRLHASLDQLVAHMLPAAIWLIVLHAEGSVRLRELEKANVLAA